MPIVIKKPATAAPAQTVFNLAGGVTLHCGDCYEVLRGMPPGSVDAIVSDAPYGLSVEPDADEVLRHWLVGDDYAHRGKGFMNSAWDSFVPGPAIWRECYRVLKPGGHMLVFFGTRTYDLGVIAIRLAKFQIRDQFAWIYGSGFPKSLNVSKAIDEHLGAEPTLVSELKTGWKGTLGGKSSLSGLGEHDDTRRITTGTTPEAKQWEGWSTSVKPAFEPIVLARKPLIGTVAENVLRHGTGALNIDASRISSEKLTGWSGKAAGGNTWNDSNTGLTKDGAPRPVEGRYPSNVIHDGSEEATAGFPFSKDGTAGKRSGVGSVGMVPGSYDEEWGGYGGGGSASRYFYSAKAGKSDRDGSEHPTVKPVDLMRYFVEMITPVGGIVLDPFAGTGTTAAGARKAKGIRAVLIEREPKYQEDIKRRFAK